MKHALLILILIVTGCRQAAAQVPSVATGTDLSSFIPAGWRIIKQVSGDLNKDSLEDIAIVIQNTDKKNTIVKKGYDIDTLDANPRTLLVLFKQPAGAYKLIAKNDSFILPHNNPGMDEPFSGISIEKGNLNINFHLWYNAGSWYSSEHAYTFRYQDGDFALIGVEDDEYHRGSGDDTHYSINFLAKRYSIKTSNRFDAKSKPETTWKTFELKSLKTFATFHQPFTWYFLRLSL